MKNRKKAKQNKKTLKRKIYVNRKTKSKTVGITNNIIAHHQRNTKRLSHNNARCKKGRKF